MPNLPSRPSISIIGAGKVGSTLARLLSASGYQITAIYNRTPEKAVSVANELGVSVAETLDEVLSADLIFLTVADDVIEAIAEQLSHYNHEGKAINCPYIRGSRHR